jgi:hypothetical protein
VALARELSVWLLTLCVFTAPSANALPAILGTITIAQRAQVGSSRALVGTTVFDGDELRTEADGSLQIRAGAARFLLSNSSAATLSELEGAPGATLLAGTALISTANAKAFVLRALAAEVRPQSDAPTVGRVSILGPRKLYVRSNRGALVVKVEGETKVIPEGEAYDVNMDPSAPSVPAPEPPQGPQGAGSGNGANDRDGSHFVRDSLIVAGVATAIGVYFALESPDRP